MILSESRRSFSSKQKNDPMRLTVKKAVDRIGFDAGETGEREVSWNR